MKKADKIFEEASKKLNKGEIIAIDEDSGDYAVGETVLEAYKKAAKQHPGKTFIFKRIGFNYVYFVGISKC